MKTILSPLSPLLIVAALMLAGFAPLPAAQLHLRYEWAPDTNGPFAPIPAHLVQVQGDGSVAVATEGPRGFFRLRINEAGAGGTGGTVPVLPISVIPEPVLGFLRQFREAVGTDESGGGNSWRGASFAPFVTPIFSPENESDSPDMVEIKVLGNLPARQTSGIFPHLEEESSERECGFLLVSLSRALPPVVGYETSGRTPAEDLLIKCQGQPVHRLRRFGPSFLGAENADGELIANDGLLPVLFSDADYEALSRPVSLTHDSEATENPPLPRRPSRAVPLGFPSYRHLREAYRSSPWLAARRTQRARLTEFDWLSLEGRAPTLEVPAGGTTTVLGGQRVVAFRVDDEDSLNLSRVLNRGDGLELFGLAPGSQRLTVRLENGLTERFNLLVRPPGPPPGGDNGVFVERRAWAAGPHPADSSEAWESQPFFSQRADLERWCDPVGCGPVMLALMIAWEERFSNVPSAFWSRISVPLAARRASLREIDSPKTYLTGNGSMNMRQWYDDLHDSCDVICGFGSGATMPWSAGSALFGYFGLATGPLLPVSVALDEPSPLMGGSAHWEADIISDDWDESGIRTAGAIKNGRPGGVLYQEHWHYCLAWKYTRITTTVRANGQDLISWHKRFFTVNHGNGKTKRVWNAYDIDGCYLLRLSQKRLPPP